MRLPKYLLIIRNYFEITRRIKTKTNEQKNKRKYTQQENSLGTLLPTF
jgi:hypothetical protein